MSAVLVEPVPITTEADGTIRVGGTRVTLDLVIASFQDGASAEEIVLQFPTLALADVYQVITYYLRHRPEVEQYLRLRECEAVALRAKIEARWPPEGLRARLMARGSKPE